MEVVVYGLSTCSTTRAAVSAIRAPGRAVRLRDVRAEPLTQSERERFLAGFGSSILNRASATWRALGDAERDLPADTLLQWYPSIMKRPVIDTGGALLLGWTDAVKASLA